MKVTSRVTSKGGGKLDELVRRMKDRGGAVLVGVPAGAESQGQPLVQVGAVHEFGSPARGIPERSFLRSTMAERRANFVRLNRKNLRLLVRGETDEARALGELGEYATGQVKRRFVVGPFVPLKASTIARKGSSKPLIDTGALRQSIAWEIEK